MSVSSQLRFAGFLAPQLEPSLIKEFIQLARDRITFGMIIIVPLMQLLLFGYAINTTPRHLPTAVLLQEHSDLGRSILQALENTRYFKVTQIVHALRAELDHLLASGKVLFAVEIPRWFRASAAAWRPSGVAGCGRCDRSRRVGTALGALARSCRQPCLTIARCRTAAKPPFEIRIHAALQSRRPHALNIVPGLLGTILTMTMLIFTALSVTREIERGTMESLLAMPITPVEIMIGKIAPYVVIGFVQASLIIGIGVLLFGVPIVGSLTLLALLTTLFIAANLAIGYTFSTLAQNQLQAMQMAIMFFLPNILLSGFMFPFAGMPVWAQWVGECAAADPFPPHRAGDHAEGLDARRPAARYAALFGLMLLAMAIAVTRFRRTLD